MPRLKDKKFIRGEGGMQSPNEIMERGKRGVARSTKQIAKEAQRARLNEKRRKSKGY